MDPSDPSPPAVGGRRRRSRRRASLVAVALLLLAATPGLRAEEPTTRERLNQARDLERIPGDVEAALTIYEEVVRSEPASAEDRADALTGAARCHLAAGRVAMAMRYWDRILADPDLREQARDWARRKKAEALEAERENGGTGNTEAAVEQALATFRAEQRRRAAERVAQARRDLDAGRFDAARHLCFEALSLDHENREAATLLEQIESRRPDRGDLLRRLVQFLQTEQLEEYQRLKDTVEQLERNGKLAFDKRDYAEADRAFREAIRRIDQSGFLVAGGALSLDSFGTARMRLIQWLRETIDRGTATGLPFEPEPPLPPFEERAGGVQKEFYALLARVFNPGEAGVEPLRFYEFAPREAPGGESRRLVSSNFFDGLRATHRTGHMTRARWAERWIRRNIGAAWIDPALPAARGGSRILTRFGNLICAQHREEEHRRIRALRDAFAATPRPLRVDVHVFACDGAGAVRAAEKLRVHAGARESGLDLEVPGRLVEECVGDLAAIQDLVQLGSAQALLDGESAFTLELTRQTAEHPAYVGTPPPPLAVPDADARYGLWLDLYAEDMPGRPAAGGDRSALSVRARILQPADALASHVVPRAGAGGLPWTRLPVLVEQTLETDRELPHFATFMLLGLANPFPKTRATHPELIVLIGTRPQDTPTPDPPRTQPTPRIIPEDAQTKEYPLGSLAQEVQDAVVPLGWPELRTTAEEVPVTDRMRLRNEYLTLLLGQMAGLEQRGPEDAEGVAIREGRATATLSTEEHHRLEQTVLRLRSHENDLYQVGLQAAVLPKTRWDQWVALEGVRGNERGNLLLAGTVRQAIEQELQGLAAREGVFNSATTLLARATQQVAHVHVRGVGITKDLHVRMLDHGRQRYTAVPGLAEEGLVVEVRPGIELADLGRRSVYVRARVAHLDRIETRGYPRAALAAARYEVPFWYKGDEGAVAQRSDAEILDDETALLLGLDLPGAPDRVVALLVTVGRVQ